MRAVPQASGAACNIYRQNVQLTGRYSGLFRIRVLAVLAATRRKPAFRPRLLRRGSSAARSPGACNRGGPTAGVPRRARRGGEGAAWAQGLLAVAERKTGSGKASPAQETGGQACRTAFRVL